MAKIDKKLQKLTENGKIDLKTFQSRSTPRAD